MFGKKELSFSRDSSLVELEAELRRAYMKKYLESQIREKQTEREIARIRENYETTLSRQRELKIGLEERKRDHECRSNRETYRKELEKQISDKDRRKKEAELEATRERRLLVEFDRIVEENEISQKIERRKKLSERTIREKRILEEMRAIRDREIREREEKLERDVKIYEEEIAQRSRELEIFIKEQTNRREKLLERVTEIFLNMEFKKKMEEIEKNEKIREMAAEEIAWEIVIQEREEELRRKRMRELLKKGLDEQMKFSIEMKDRRQALDREFSESLIKRIMDDDKMENLSKEVRTRKRMAYREDLMKLMEEREKMRRREIERIKNEFERDKEIEEIRKNQIASARQEILKEHARNVGTYISDAFLTQEEKDIVKNLNALDSNIAK